MTALIISNVFSLGAAIVIVGLTYPVPLLPITNPTSLPELVFNCAVAVASVPLPPGAAITTSGGAMYPEPGLLNVILFRVPPVTSAAVAVATLFGLLTAVNCCSKPANSLPSETIFTVAIPKLNTVRFLFVKRP